MFTCGSKRCFFHLFMLPVSVDPSFVTVVNSPDKFSTDQSLGMIGFSHFITPDFCWIYGTRQLRSSAFTQSIQPA